MTREMPPMTKRLRRLRRDSRGFPIPYVALWTSEHEGPPAELRVVTLPSVTWTGHAVRQMDTRGVGHVLFGRIEPWRQLHAHELRLCNVCGQEIGRTLTFVGGPSENRRLQCYSEAPLHRTCAIWSLQVCPALLVGRAEAGLIVSEIRAEEVVYAGDFIWRDGTRNVLPFSVVTPEHEAVLIGVRAFTSAGRLRDSEEWLHEQKQ